MTIAKGGFSLYPGGMTFNPSSLIALITRAGVRLTDNLSAASNIYTEDEALIADLTHALELTLARGIPEAVADSDESFELGKVAGYDEAMAEVAAKPRFLFNFTTYQTDSRSYGKNITGPPIAVFAANELEARAKVFATLAPTSAYGYEHRVFTVDAVEVS